MIEGESPLNMEHARARFPILVEMAKIYFNLMINIIIMMPKQLER